MGGNKIALDLAQENGHIEIVELLLKAKEKEDKAIEYQKIKRSKEKTCILI